MKTLAEVRKAIKAGKFEFEAGSDRQTYNWADLLDGTIKTLEEGKDYKCKTTTFAMMARNQAARKRKVLKATQVEGGLVIQATAMTAEQIEAQEAKEAKQKEDKATKKAAEVSHSAVAIIVSVAGRSGRLSQVPGTLVLPKDIISSLSIIGSLRGMSESCSPRRRAST